MIIVKSSFLKTFVFKTFFVRTNTQSRRFKIPPIGRAHVFEKPRFRDRLVWTVGLIGESKAPFFEFLRRGVNEA